MQSIPNDSARMRGLKLACALSVVAVCLSETRFLATIDNLVYDAFVSYTVTNSGNESNVLLVDISDHEECLSDPSRFSELVQKLHDAGATRIGIAAPLPAELDRDTLPNVTLTFAMPSSTDAIHTEEIDPGSYDLDSPYNGTTNPLAVQSGVLAPPMAEYGIHRHFRAATTDGHATWEAVIAGHTGTGPAQRIRFTEILPSVTANRVLSNGLIAEMVSDRTVLVGSSRLDDGVAYVPQRRDNEPLSLFELRGHVVNTMLTRSAISDLSTKSRLTLVVLVVAISAMFISHMAPRMAFLLCLLFQVILMLTTCGLAASVRVWIPAGQILVLQLLTFILVGERKAAFARSALAKLLLELSTKIWQRRWPEDFFNDDDPWPRIVAFIRQTLALNRLMILELPEGSRHVRDVCSANCTREDIQELRRDIRRRPYTDAIQQDGPFRINVSRRPFLSATVPDEDQYLVPLRFGGRLFGFLAIGVLRDVIGKRDEFEERLRDFALQTVELLYRHRCLLTERKQGNSLSTRIWSLPEERAYQELMHATHLIGHRLDRMEHIYRDSSVGSAVYDLFGQKIMVNARMETILQREGIPIENLTTVDLLARLANVDTDRAREVLSQVIVERRPETLPVHLTCQRGSYLVHVCPLELEASTSSSATRAVNPLQIQGILCELIDRTSLIEMYRLKDQLSETLGHSLRNDLAAVGLATNLLLCDGVQQEEREHFAGMVHEKVDEAVSALVECQRFLSFDGAEDVNECVPVAPEPLLQNAWSEVHERFEDRSLEMIIQRPDLTSHVFAVPRQLRNCFDAIFELLASDARSRTTITAQVDERVNDVVFTFTNVGVGLPTDRLEAAFAGTGSNDEFEPLVQASEEVGEWGGSLVVSSRVGDGTQMKLHLRRFH